MALSETARNNGIKAVLTGEGSDELFAGYVGYRFDRLRRREAPPVEAYDLDAALEAEVRLRLWGDEKLFYEVDFLAFEPTKRALYSPIADELFPEYDSLNHSLVNREMLRDRHFTHQRSYLDFKLRLSDHLISDHGDRMALANSVEARYPFLDFDLVEFAREIPPDLKLNGFKEKYLLKRLAEGKVLPEIVQREKFAFHAPGSPYLLRRGIEWVNDILSFDRIKRQGYFNPHTVETLKTRYSREGFKLNLPFESDLLIVVLTFGIFLDLFKMPDLA
jgi:asparagine synthase (glutamine-hydrolysing)